MEQTAERARAVMDSRTGNTQAGTSAVSGGNRIPAATERPTLLETHHVLEKCLNPWPTMNKETESSNMAPEDLKLQGDTLYRDGKCIGNIPYWL